MLKKMEKWKNLQTKTKKTRWGFCCVLENCASCSASYMRHFAINVTRLGLVLPEQIWPVLQRDTENKN